MYDFVILPYLRVTVVEEGLYHRICAAVRLLHAHFVWRALVHFVLAVVLCLHDSYTSVNIRAL